MVSDHEDVDVIEERDRVRMLSRHDRLPVLIKHLRKVYNEGSEDAKVAVADLCLALEPGECFGLLGENGAGKTTTLSMLTGLYPPSGGRAFIGGYDVVRQTDQVHLLIGTCPQHDVLWDTLTVEEHLQFYARLKGVPKAEEHAHVAKSMERVGLSAFRERLSKDLSGGMKRRLSIAISLVGHSAIVFLDEPTTGLDPASRRQIWNILESAKRDCALVLCSHAMDEVEVLCNRIGIMAHGRLRCLGSQQRLKSLYGGGYCLSVNFAPSDAAAVDALVLSVCPTAVVIARFRSYAAFQLPAGTIRVSEVFEVMERRSAAHGVTDWAVGQVGLDDVFTRIVEMHRPQSANAV